MPRKSGSAAVRSGKCRSRFTAFDAADHVQSNPRERSRRQFTYRYAHAAALNAEVLAKQFALVGEWSR